MIPNPEEKAELINWLLTGDIAIQYQTHRDLLQENRPDLRARIANEGWGARFIAARGENGHWGRGYYQPKWISTHYTLLDLKNLNVAPDHHLLRQSVELVLIPARRKTGASILQPQSREATYASTVCF